MDFKAILQKYWGYEDFRGIQLPIIESIAADKDTLGLMPTGGGKSLTFQVPTLAKEGMCLVITPLIALMKDQVSRLKAQEIPAEALYSGQRREDTERFLTNAVYGAYKFLYISPERLATEGFKAKVKKMNLCLIAVDEAHCISQWGYDFRPAYLRIGELRKELPEVPVLALTATATPRVVKDIQEKLGFRKNNVFRMSFARPNLRYVVREAEDKRGELLHILNSLTGSAIVYTWTRDQTQDIADFLEQNGISAIHYHAGLNSFEKWAKQKIWKEDNIRVMVATNAFGMGIDKPDVRLVVHLNAPDSVEAYFQEAGRAGRDGLTAYAVLLYNPSDARTMRRRLTEAFPERQYIRQVYADLAAFFQIAEGEAEGKTFEFDILKFCRAFHHAEIKLHGALSLLTQAGYINYRGEEEGTSRLLFLCRREDLYHLDDLPLDEEKVIETVLRIYGGVFVNYVAIEEDYIASLAGLSSANVYQALKLLTARRILQYIPKKKVPRITYCTRRLDEKYIEIGRDIYEQRKNYYAECLKAMLDYCTEQRICRSRLLLHYFDDECEDCGHCDVCIEQRKKSANPRPEEFNALVERYEKLLSDGQPHPPTDFQHSEFQNSAHHAAMDFLLGEGKMKMENGMYAKVP